MAKKLSQQQQAWLSAKWRFVRVIIPQIPALVAQAVEIAKVVSLPDWVVPSLVFLGAIATALDKYLRALKK